MIEYEFLEFWSDNAGYAKVNPLINGVRGPHKLISGCKTCGVLVVDEALHTAHHESLKADHGD